MSLRRKTVLVVDPDERARESIIGPLKRDYRVLRAGAGGAAAEVLMKEEVDVVLTEIALPDMTGAELLQLTRVNFPLTEVILTSADANGPNSVMRAPVDGLIIWNPTTSVGWRSARPWSRANFALLIAARITPKNVFPTPGTPLSRRFPALTCRCSRLS